MKFVKKFLKIVVYTFCGIILLGMAKGIINQSGVFDNEEQAQARLEQEERNERIRENNRIAEANKKKSEKMKGFHCLSAWDGSLRDDRALKNSLNDPGSYEHIGTKITPVNSEGVHTAYVTFRARNGFGGMVVSKATIIVSNDTCNNAVLEIQ